MTSTDLATIAPSTGALALAGDQIEWTDVQQRALEHIGVAAAPPADQAVFLHVSQRTGLDPFAKQIYMIERKERGKNGQPDKIKWTIQTGIDGFRLIAERHRQYAGTLDPQWCGEDGVWREAWVDRRPPVAARVKVLRHDRAHPISLPVRFVEFAATFSDGNLQGQWKTKPAHMIAKVAEAAALRKAFPQDFSGLYIAEEMDHDDTTRRHHVASEHASQPVTVAELTGPPTSAPDKTRGPAGGAASPAAADPSPPGPPPPGEEPGELVDDEPRVGDDIPSDDATTTVTTRQNRRMHALFREAGCTDRAERLKVTGLILGRTLTTSAGLTVADATVIIDRLLELGGDSGRPDALSDAVTDLINTAALQDEPDATGGAS